MVEKRYETAARTLDDLREHGIIHDGMTVMVGGFGLCGIPEHLIAALRDTGVEDITCISNNAGVDDWGLGLLLQTRQIKKMVSSYVGENAIFEKQFLDGDLEVEFNPQGTLAERIRAGGAGIPGFYTPSGAGTIIADGKDTRDFQRPSDLGQGRPREYILETGLYADLSLVKAHRADGFGNLQYRMTARNFNPMMATAARFVVAEVDEIVETGTFDPDQIHTPGSYVDRIVQTVSEKRIEQRTVSQA
jgi:3-oxoacid CoA-transferase subunit A